MPFPTGYALSDREWNEVLEVVSVQAAEDGIDTADFPAMLELFRTGFGIVNDAALRLQFLDHLAPTRLDEQESDAADELSRVRAEIAALPPDPGPVPPR